MSVCIDVHSNKRIRYLHLKLSCYVLSKHGGIVQKILIEASSLKQNTVHSKIKSCGRKKITKNTSKHYNNRKKF